MQKLESRPTLAVGSEWDLQSVSPFLSPLMLSFAMIPLVHWCDTGIMTKVGWKSLDIAWIENACQKAVTSNWHQKQTLPDKNTLKIRNLSIDHDSAHLFPIQSKIPIRRVLFSHLCRLERSLPRSSREHLWPPIVCSTLCNSTKFWKRLQILGTMNVLFNCNFLWRNQNHCWA